MKRGTTVASIALAIIVGVGALPVAADPVITHICDEEIEDCITIPEPPNPDEPDVTTFLCDDDGCRSEDPGGICEPGLVEVCLKVTASGTYYRVDDGEVTVNIRVDSYERLGVHLDCLSFNGNVDVEPDVSPSGTTCNALEDLGFSFVENVVPWTGVSEEPPANRPGYDWVILDECEADITVLIGGNGYDQTQSIPCLVES